MKTPFQSEYIAIRRQALFLIPGTVAQFDITARQLLPANPTPQDWVAVARKLLQTCQAYDLARRNEMFGAEQCQ